ncbi:hypothetical protein C8Q70DRAFT_1039039 [Cubamyces menziesii]|nr:hypothetical protein C8Q70DRAFT_1039039 [Cubamyces menziesii]
MLPPRVGMITRRNQPPLAPARAHPFRPASPGLLYPPPNLTHSLFRSPYYFP